MRNAHPFHSTTVAARTAGVLCVLALLAAVPASAGPTAAGSTDGETLQAGFTPGTAKLPEGWTPISFQDINRTTDYAMVCVKGRAVLRAVADRSASGLVWGRGFDPRVYRTLRWSWRISHTLPRGNVTRREGDDFAARLLVMFPYDPERATLWERIKYNTYRLFYGEFPPGQAMTYIWANKLPRGRWVTSTYTDRVRLHSVESGNARAGQWVRVERDLAADYRAAFGEPVPGEARIAVMVDTDNTEDRVTSWYGPVRLLRDPRL